MPPEGYRCLFCNRHLVEYRGPYPTRIYKAYYGNVCGRDKFMRILLDITAKSTVLCPPRVIGRVELPSALRAWLEKRAQEEFEHMTEYTT